MSNGQDDPFASIRDPKTGRISDELFAAAVADDNRRFDALSSEEQDAEVQRKHEVAMASLAANPKAIETLGLVLLAEGELNVIDKMRSEDGFSHFTPEQKQWFSGAFRGGYKHEGSLDLDAVVEDINSDITTREKGFMCDGPRAPLSEAEEEAVRAGYKAGYDHPESAASKAAQAQPENDGPAGTNGPA